ncbi:DNA repair protein RadA [Candidatus Woesebacteria bacterium]|nr:DNA repair protein RadA [Candidatus Woesebacteria bacterium]
MKSKYVCQQCGYSQVGWAGKCPNCNSWGSLVETVVSTNSKLEKTTKPVNLSDIPSKATSRISTKISELDRVLGGGLVQGQVILVAGEPGIGKSTLLLQVAGTLGALYVSGEESVNQIKIRADRLGIRNKNIQLLEETDIDSVIQSFSDSVNKTPVIVVDSIQTMTTADLSGMAGSVGQVRESAFRLVRLAKSRNIPIFIVGHVTKEGTVAGPAVLAHIVDSVLWFEGDKSLSLRLIRAVKNRFGPTDEVGIFTMEDKGLVSLEDPEKLFLSRTIKVAGSVTTSIMEGTRPILVEVQSLVVPTKLAFPKRIAQGIDSRRFELLLAVLQRRAGIPLYEYDAFVNVAGGITVREPGADLAICLSVASSFFDKPVLKEIIAVGEVGLLGEVRAVSSLEKRIKEAKRLGFKIPVTYKQVQYVNQVIRKYVK